MKTFALAASPREALGKKSAKTARKNGLIPAVLYGSEPLGSFDGKLNAGEKLVELPFEKVLVVTDFLVPFENVRKLIYTPEVFIVDLEIEGSKKTKAIVKEIQFHPVTDQILHIDFLEVFDDKPIVVQIPVKLKGYAEGVKAGGKLHLEKRKLHVKALHKLLPENLEVDIEHLALGKTIQVGDLHFEGLELIDAKNAVVCSVKLTRAARGAASGEELPGEEGEGAEGEETEGTEE